ncbi:MAG: ATP-binding protein [Treponema sp.]|nr:ATP-binding protein [Treponema sp.]
MQIRIRAAVSIILTNLFIIAFSVLVGTAFVRNNVNRSQETDLMVIAGIADSYISSEIETLKVKAAAAAKLLSVYESTQWPEILTGLESGYEFTGIAVWDEERGIIAAAGELPPPEAIENRHVQQAFQGKSLISSTVQTPGGTVFYLAAPVPGSSDKILTFTLPCTYFSDLLSAFVIWRTGHIFMDDAQGVLVANPRSKWVEDGVDFSDMASIDPENREKVDNIRRAADGNAGIVRYSIDGVPRLCAYRSVSGSEEGWSLGTVAPLPESPFGNTGRGLFVVGLVAFFLSVIAAVIASKFVKKPYEEIAALKELAESNSMYKSTFLANMSHEMRTPLNVVVGLTDLRMEDGRLPPDVQEDIKKINSAGELLMGLIHDVLDISKIEAGKLELMLVNYQTASLFNDIITLNMLRIESKPIKFRIEISEDFPEELYGDELRVKQIFNNILSNAFKYTKEGSVTFSVECINSGEKDMVLSATVSDTGIGIRQEDIDKLFFDYNRVDTRTNRNVEGTGLGLSITKKLVEVMNGEITVESVYGEGSTFHVKIKQGIVSSKGLGSDIVENLRNFRYTEHKQNTSRTLVRPDLSYARVLVVDDMQTNLDVAAGLMRKYKMQVDCVTRGQAAIDLIKAEEPVYDAVFVDHMMPEMDGIETTQLIRAIDSEYARTLPIISLTANALAGNEQKFLNSGFNAFLSKPINIFKLDSVIKKWVRRKTADIE